MSPVLFNVEAEATILATLLHHTAKAGAAFTMVPEDFALASHQELFRAMIEEIQQGRKPAAAVVTARLRDLTGDGGYVFKISGKADADAVPSCVASVRHLAALRRLAETAKFVTEAVAVPDVKAIDLATAMMEQANHAIANVGHRLQPAMLERAGADFLAMLESKTDLGIIPTGFQTLDRRIGGLPRQELTLLAGRPSMGKSALVASLARRMAQAGHPVALFSLEMPRNAVIARILTELTYKGPQQQGNIFYSDLLRRQASEAQRDEIRAAYEMLRGIPLLIDDQPGLTMAEIQARSMKFDSELEKNNQRLAVVIIDHLGKVRASDRYAGNMVHETGEKSDAMMVMAKMMDVAVLAAQQLNRGPDSREDPRPILSDLRDSGNLEQDAHTVLFLYRAAYYLERQKFDDPMEEAARLTDLSAVVNLLEMGIAKSRNGSIGIQKMFCDLPHNTISDLASEVAVR